MGANAQTTVPTFTTGQVLTADQMNQSARTGVPVFADSTARDAGFGGSGEKTKASCAIWNQPTSYSITTGQLGRPSAHRQALLHKSNQQQKQTRLRARRHHLQTSPD